MTQSLKITPESNRACLSCGLFLNQLPLKDNKAHADIFWVGLSAVKLEQGSTEGPLAKSTRTGELISKIERTCPDEVFYKTNMVKCLPLKENDKIRYPSKSEMQDCYPNLELELEILKPQIVFLLGKQVSEFVLAQFGLKIQGLSSEMDYGTFHIDNTLFVPIHHPSYILVYRRKKIQKYIDALSSMIAKEFRVKSKTTC